MTDADTIKCLRMALEKIAIIDRFWTDRRIATDLNVPIIEEGENDRVKVIGAMGRTALQALEDTAK